MHAGTPIPQKQILKGLPVWHLGSAKARLRRGSAEPGTITFCQLWEEGFSFCGAPCREVKPLPLKGEVFIARGKVGLREGGEIFTWLFNF